MTSSSDNTPIIIGVGDVRETLNETLLNDLSKASLPTDLAAEAAELALNDAGVEAQQIDVLAVVRDTQDTIPNSAYPFGRSDNPPASVAKRLGITNPIKSILSSAGGNTPQALVNEWAEKLAIGSASVVMLTGAEAMATFKAALRSKQQLNWSEKHDLEQHNFEDRGPAIDGMIGPEEIRHGLTFPNIQYAVIENAKRAQNGLSYQDHAKNNGELFSPFSEVAAKNEYAMFPQAYTASEIATPSDKNAYVNFPYTYRMVAKDTVNLAAAILLSTVGKARELGVPEEKWVYLHGHAHSRDIPLIKREHLGESIALNRTLKVALANAGIKASDVSVFDIYSCYPIAVELAKEALEFNNDHPVLTQTGGLAYFGGPGNNYAMHGINSVVRELRKQPKAIGLASANGGMLEKHAVGVYSCQPGWSTWDPTELHSEVNQQTQVLTETSPNGIATIESYTVTFNKGRPVHAVVVGRIQHPQEDKPRRFLANPQQGSEAATIQNLLSGDCIGKTILASSSGKSNTFVFAEHS